MDALSPSRMNDFLGCEYRTWIDLERAAGRLELQRVPRPDAELILERGRRHEQLADGGRLVVPLDGGSQRLTLIRRRGGRLERESHEPVRFVPLVSKRP